MGIIAKVSAYLAKHSINIDDITQTVISGNFVMMMIVDFSSADLGEELMIVLFPADSKHLDGISVYSDSAEKGRQSCVQSRSRKKCLSSAVMT